MKQTVTLSDIPKVWRLIPGYKIKDKSQTKRGKMQFPDISASMLALKGLKHDGKPLTFDEINALLDQMIELFNLRKETTSESIRNLSRHPRHVEFPGA